MPRPPFWVFSLAGFLFFFFFFFFFWGGGAVFHLLTKWTFWGSFASVFRNLSHFDALSLHPSCLNVLAHFYAWWIFSFFWWTLFWMNLVFLLEWWILGSSKLDAHFTFSHIDGISFLFPWLSENSIYFDDLLSLA